MNPELTETRIPLRTVHEWGFRTSRTYAEPFTDVTVRATFEAPSGEISTIEGFHDGGNEWKVRFNPGQTGQWRWRLESTPPNPDFERDGVFEVDGGDVRGFLKSTPGEAWGFAFENGEPVMIFGDTVYHMFGMAHIGEDGREAVGRFLRRRAEQGFNLLRIRLPVSDFPPGRWVQHVANTKPVALAWQPAESALRPVQSRLLSDCRLGNRTGGIARDWD
jgi:hypothetical protein